MGDCASPTAGWRDQKPVELSSPELVEKLTAALEVPGPIQWCLGSIGVRSGCNCRVGDDEKCVERMV